MRSVRKANHPEDKCNNRAVADTYGDQSRSRTEPVAPRDSIELNTSRNDCLFNIRIIIFLSVSFDANFCVGLSHNYLHFLIGDICY